MGSSVSYTSYQDDGCRVRGHRDSLQLDKVWVAEFTGGGGREKQLGVSEEGGSEEGGVRREEGRKGEGEYITYYSRFSSRSKLSRATSPPSGFRVFTATSCLSIIRSKSVV